MKQEPSTNNDIRDGEGIQCLKFSCSWIPYIAFAGGMCHSMVPFSTFPGEHGQSGDHFAGETCRCHLGLVAESLGARLGAGWRAGTFQGLTSLLGLARALGGSPRAFLGLADACIEAEQEQRSHLSDPLAISLRWRDSSRKTSDILDLYSIVWVGCAETSLSIQARDHV